MLPSRKSVEVNLRRTGNREQHVRTRHERRLLFVEVLESRVLLTASAPPSILDFGDSYWADGRRIPLVQIQDQVAVGFAASATDDSKHGERSSILARGSS